MQTLYTADTIEAEAETRLETSKGRGLTMVYPTALDAKVAAVNLANKTANETYPILRDIFEPLVGTTINKKDGTLLAKIAKLLPEFPCTPRLHIYKYSSDYSLVWVAKTCCTAPGMHADCQHAHYHEANIYVGHVRNGILESLHDAPNLRTDYAVDEILAARERYKIAEQAASEAKSALFPFGEYDR